MSDTEEFDCIECGRHIVRMAGLAAWANTPKLCAACLMMPGWMDEPAIAAVLDPEHHRSG